MQLKTLHISDLHIKDDSLSQDIVLTSLIKKVQSIVSKSGQFDLLLVTGDIAHGGKTSEYEQAKKFLDQLISIGLKEKRNVFIIPGNHDVDRSKIKKEEIHWWYSFDSEERVNESLSSTTSFPKLMENKEAYKTFTEYYMDPTNKQGKFGQFVHEVRFPDIGNVRIKIVGLNSALFCGYDGDDKEKLAIGLEQITYCEGLINNEEDFVITCVHHPFKCFHPCEKPVQNVLKRFSDIILSGHLHEPSAIFTKEGNTGDTIFVSAGASFYKRQYENAFNSVIIDLEKNEGLVHFYKYLPSDHIWVENHDLQYATDGCIRFPIAKKKKAQPQLISSTPLALLNPTQYSYSMKLELAYDDLNRDVVNSIVATLKAVTGDEKLIITNIDRGSVVFSFISAIKITKKQVEQLQTSNIYKVKEFKEIGTVTTSRVIYQNSSILNWKFQVKADFLNEICNPGTNYTHSGLESEQIMLKDLFVAPNLRRIKNEEEKKGNGIKVINANEVISKKDDERFRVVIYGDDYSGKSTLSKWAFEKLYQRGYIPIMLSGRSIKDVVLEKLKKTVEKAFIQQYEKNIEGEFNDIDPKKIVLIIDDFHKITFKHSKYRANLIANLDRGFENFLLMGDKLMRLETFTTKSGLIKNSLENYDRYEMLEFGPSLRHELVEKWNSLDSSKSSPNKLIKLNKDSESYIESIIGKNFVPAFPVYLLTILQARESIIKNPEFSLHGFYYELLINDALGKAVKKKEDISLYYNYITDYAYFLFANKIRLDAINIGDFEKFHAKYCAEYEVTIGYKEVLNTLVNSKLLSAEYGSIKIAYNYVYYYFVAKYLANNIAVEDIRIQVRALCERVHRDEYGSIVMFLTHLSKDQFIITQLLENSRNQFSNQPAIKLEEDVVFIDKMIKQLPDQIYKPIDIDERRKEELKESEELEIQEKEFDSEREILDYDLNEDISSLDMISRMTRATKTIEIMGQVTKKYWGELKANQKVELTEETYMLGLRTIGFTFELIESHSDRLIEYIKGVLLKRNERQGLTRIEIDNASRSYLFAVCALSTYGYIKRVTEAIGYDKLAGTFETVLEKNPYNSVRLIDTSIKMDYSYDIPWEDLELISKNTKDFPLANSVLKNIALNYLYVYHSTDYEKQRLGSLTGIKMDIARMLDASSKVKKGE